MSIETLKLALEALKQNHYYMIDAGLPNQSMLKKTLTAYKALEEALAKQEQVEPVAWMRQDGQRVTTASDRHNYPDYETRYSIPLYTKGNL
jgi:hypothetical protein